MNKIDQVAIRLFLFLHSKGIKIKQTLNRPELLIIAVAMVIIFVAPNTVYAWEPKAAADNVFNFIKFIIFIAAAVIVITALLKSQMVTAITVVCIGALLYIVLDENIMKALGRGLAHLLALDGGGE